MKTNNLTISNESKLTIFGGVNVIESDDLLFEVADKFVQLSGQGLILKYLIQNKSI